MWEPIIRLGPLSPSHEYVIKYFFPIEEPTKSPKIAKSSIEH